MFRTGRALVLDYLLILQPLLTQAGGNSLLIPATGRCVLNTVPEELQQTLAACQQITNGDDAETQYELGKFLHDGERIPRNLRVVLSWFEKASLQGRAQAQYHLNTMFFRGEGVPASNVQAYTVLKVAAVNGTEDALDSVDPITEQMNRDELDIVTRVLGQILRNYLIELQTAGGVTPLAPLP